MATAPAPTDIDVDSIIQRLLEVRGSRPGKPVQLAENEIKGLCTKAREIFINQPVLLELAAPIKICGMYNIFYTVGERDQVGNIFHHPYIYEMDNMKERLLNDWDFCLILGLCHHLLFFSISSIISL